MTNNTKYRIAQFCYSAQFVIAYGYVAYYLGEYGYPSGQIGILTSVFAMLAVIIQPILGRLADRNVFFGWKTLALIISGLNLLDLILLLVLRNRFWIGICYASLVLFVNCLLPISNATAFYYEDSEEPINYGIARGIGSLGYAIVSALVGQLIIHFGKQSIIVVGILLSVGYLLMTVLMPYDFKRVIVVEETQEETQKTNFMKKYPAFMWMVVSCACLLTFHNGAQTYLINMIAPFGGDASHIGIALAISALAELPPMFFMVYLLKKIKVEKLMLIAAIGFVVKAFGYTFMRSLGVLYAVQTLQMVSYAITISASVYYTNAVIEKEDANTGHSLMGAIVAIGTVVGNTVGGILVEHFGLPALFTFCITFTILGLVFVLVAIQKGKKENEMNTSQ